MASHTFVANCSMDRKYFRNADVEMLIVPQENSLNLSTEMGIVIASPGEIDVIPRGIKRGPIGANCLANARDFLYLAAAYEDVQEECELYLKSRGRMFRTVLQHSPLDVVAWHGNYAPYKYDLKRFSPVGATLFDHPDP